MMIRLLPLYGVILMALTGCNNSSNRNNENDDQLSKPERIIDLKITFSAANTESERAHLLLIVDSTDQKADTIELTNCLVYDRMPPRSYTFNEIVVFEDCSQNPSQIKAMNLENFEVTFNEEGFMNIFSESENPYDGENNVLICFSKFDNTHDQYLVNKLELKTLDYSTLDTLVTSGDPLTGLPFAHILDETNRMVRISYEAKNDEYISSDLNY